MKTKKYFGYILIILVFVFGAFFVFNNKNSSTKNSQENADKQIENKTKEVEITPNSTFGSLTAEAGLNPNLIQALLNVSQPVYDLAKIRVGRKLVLTYNGQSDELKQVVYQVDSEQELYLTKKEILTIDGSVATSSPTQNLWQAELKKIDYEVRLKVSSGTVKTSMYQAALDNNIDIAAVIALADAFQWSIDFAMDPRVGDTFKFVYEERYRNGKYVMPGNVLAGKYVNDGKEYSVYYFEESADNQGYFDENGNSVQKMFLKSPVSFKYITSGYTTGLRCLESYGLCTGHRAIDYAATYGTPIRSVGDGTVTFAGWSSVGYGNLTSIRHNGTYSTNYAHQSKFAVKRGQQVKQGQIIGYVGSTGLSTGPHLHFEMVKNGVKVNPLKEVLPPGTPIKPENMDRFKNVMVEDNKQLEQ